MTDELYEALLPLLKDYVDMKRHADELKRHADEADRHADEAKRIADEAKRQADDAKRIVDEMERTTGQIVAARDSRIHTGYLRRKVGDRVWYATYATGYRRTVPARVEKIHPDGTMTVRFPHRPDRTRFEKNYARVSNGSPAVSTRLEYEPGFDPVS